MLNSIISTPITLSSLIICLLSAMALGILSAVVFGIKHKSSQSFSLTLALLPVAMCMIIMMVNGNLGVAVGVAGSFALVRFRSIAGNGREISAIFTVMAIGVITGMGYIAVAVLFFIVASLLVLVLTLTGFGGGSEKLLKITIPEDYDYTNLFNDIFTRYGIKSEIYRIKTTNMGSLIEVTYKVSFKGDTLPRQALDDIRARNSNLSIILAPFETERESL